MQRLGVLRVHATEALPHYLCCEDLCVQVPGGSEHVTLLDGAVWVALQDLFLPDLVSRLLLCSLDRFQALFGFFGESLSPVGV